MRTQMVLRAAVCEALEERRLLSNGALHFTRDDFDATGRPKPATIERALATLTTTASPGGGYITDAESDPIIEMPDVRSSPWFSELTGAGLTAVIIDTGIDVNHDFFGADADSNGIADRIVYQYDYVNTDPDASDDHGHGSHVASIVASEDATIRGIAPDVDIIALKVADINGFFTWANLQSALQWVVANVATYNIISVNMSLGDSGHYTTAQALNGIDDELASLEALNVTLVAAAGNGYCNTSGGAEVQGIVYPAADPNVISVGAVYDGDSGGGGWQYGNPVCAIANTTGVDRIAPFSQRDDELLDIFAPGAPIMGATQSGGTSERHGTSMASPMVAGFAVIAQQLALQEWDRRMTFAEFREAIRETAVTIHDGDDEDDNVDPTNLDFLRLDAFAALTRIGEDTPFTSFGSFLGGSDREIGNATAIDGNGDIYVAGKTWSNNFPTTVGAHDTSLGGTTDGFLTKVSRTGTVLWSTYFGGSGDEEVLDVATDANGNVWIIGNTTSSNMTTLGAFDSTLGGTQDAFVARFNGTTGQLQFSSYLGGSSSDSGNAIAIGNGNTWVAGSTSSSDFTMVSAFDSTYSGGDAFIARISAADTLNFSSFLGGSGSESINAIAVDTAGNAYVTGSTTSNNYPTPNGFDTTASSTVTQIFVGGDAFVSRIDATATPTHAWGSYLEGTATDGASGIAVSGTTVWITGKTESTDFPTTNGFDTSGGSARSFVARVNSAGGAGALLSSSYLFSGLGTWAHSIAVDAAGNAWISGTTGSDEYNGFDPNFIGPIQGPINVFMARITAAFQLGSFNMWTGDSWNGGNGVSIDAAGNAWLTGIALANDFPVPNGFDTTRNGHDAFIAKADRVNAVAVPDAASVSENHASTINVLSNDTGTGLTVVRAFDPPHGTVVINGDNTITYTPDTNYVGSDSFTYWMENSANLESLGTVSITVYPFPRAWWKLDETSGTTAADSSGNSYNGTTSGGPTWVAGHSGNALNFDGVNDHVTLTTHVSNFPIAAQKRTIAGWFNAGSTGKNFFSYGANSAGQMFSITASNTKVAVDVNGYERGRNNLTLSAGWHHVAVTFPGGSSTMASAIEIYVDGDSISPVKLSGTNTTINTGTGFAYIGRHLTTYFSGKIDDVRIYNRALTEQQVEDLVGGLGPASLGLADDNKSDHPKHKENVLIDSQALASPGSTPALLFRTGEPISKFLKDGPSLLS
jgi:hypothetical protein